MTNLKRILFSGLALSLLFLLSGCVPTDKTTGLPTGEGLIYKFLIAPMGDLIQYFADNQGLGYGLSIIIVTILVRVLIIMPLGLYQSWKSTYQAEKRHYLNYIFQPIQDRLKTAETQEEKLAIQTELMAAQKEYGISMFGGIGCMPLLIQMPFFTALFYAARYTEGIAGSKFLWFQLDHSGDIPLIAIIAALYLFQAWLSMQAVPEEQREQMKTMMYSTPIMMIFFAWSSPAGVALYWLVGGIFSIIQQLIVMFIIKPKIRHQVEEEYRLNPPKPYQHKTAAPKDVTPKTQQTIENKPTSKRNAGKQRQR